jgi:hypothetical protein
MKKLLGSKTVWLNVVTLFIGIVALSQGMPEFEQYAPWLVFVSGILNLILRVFFTSTPITTFAAKK